MSIKSSIKAGQPLEEEEATGTIGLAVWRGLVGR
jgi:hypothetical protein